MGTFTGPVFRRFWRVGAITLFVALWSAAPALAAFESMNDARRLVRSIEFNDPSVDGYKIGTCTRFSATKIKCAVRDHGQRSYSGGTYNYQCSFTIVVTVSRGYLYGHGSHANCTTQLVNPPAAPAPPTSNEGVGSYDHSGDAAFCAVNQCEGNFYNEPGYIVQCNDGTYSHAGGIQGACSYHGGENPYGS